MRFKYSSGPWKVACIPQFREMEIKVKDSNNRTIAHTYKVVRPDPMVDDATLMAAAPELLELCIQLRNVLGSGLEINDFREQIYAELNSVLGRIRAGL